MRARIPVATQQPDGHGAQCGGKPVGHVQLSRLRQLHTHFCEPLRLYLQASAAAHEKALPNQAIIASYLTAAPSSTLSCNKNGRLFSQWQCRFRSNRCAARLLVTTRSKQHQTYTNRTKRTIDHRSLRQPECRPLLQPSHPPYVSILWRARSHTAADPGAATLTAGHRRQGFIPTVSSRDPTAVALPSSPSNAPVSMYLSNTHMPQYVCSAPSCGRAVPPPHSPGPNIQAQTI